MLKRLDNITQPLLTIRIRIPFPHLTRNIRNRQKSRPLKQDHLLCLRLPTQSSQIPLHNIQIRNQTINNISPSPVQTLIPYTRPIHPHHLLKRPTRLSYCSFSVAYYLFAVIGLYEVHFVDQGEDVRCGGVFC